MRSIETSIVMECVDGKTLRDVLPTLTFNQAIDIGTQTAKG